MAEYIIKPVWFYWVSVLSWLKGSCIAISILAFIISFVSSILIAVNMEYINSSIADSVEKEIKFFKKIFKISIITFIISIFGMVFIPNKEVMLEMEIAKFITKENINLSIDNIKDTIDYIIMSITTIKGW